VAVHRHALVGRQRAGLLEHAVGDADLAHVVEDAARVFVPGFEGVLAVGKRNFARVRLVAAN